MSNQAHLLVQIPVKALSTAGDDKFFADGYQEQTLKQLSSIFYS